MSLEGYFFGMFFGVLCRDDRTASNLLPMVILPIMMFGGLVVNLADIPNYISWLQYLSPMRHSVMILVQDQMSSDRFIAFSDLKLP